MKPGSARWYRLAGALLLIAYFVRMSLATLAARFAADDPMNLAYYWQLPPWQQILGPLMPWRNLYRPLAAWFLLPILHGFGLNPVPFRVAMLAILLANGLLIFRLTSLLRSGEPAAWLVALIACYHAGLSNLYFDISFVYDALCGFFFVAALLYYVSLRERAIVPSWRQVALFLGLYLAALDSKEMAVTLPLVLLLYEWLYHPGVPWCGRIRCAAAGIALTLVYLFARVLGSGGMAQIAGYRMEFTLRRVAEFHVRAFGEIFEKSGYFGPVAIAVVWLAMILLAWRLARPVLRFAVLGLLVTPLPIEFLVGRAGACLYIPMIFCAVFVSSILAEFAGFLAAHLRSPRLSAVLLAVAAVLWAHRNIDLQKRFVTPHTLDPAPLTWQAMQQLKALRPSVPPHCSVVFLNDPFQFWDMAFIAELEFRDPTVTIRLNRMTPLTPEEIANAAIVFDYRESRLVEVR
jgi:hypothetical protein